VAQEATINPAIGDFLSSAPEPDLVVVNRNFGELRARPRPADLLLVAEVSESSLRFDLSTKARLYARCGIEEYWVFDVEARRVIVHRSPVDGLYRDVAAYFEDEEVATLARPDAPKLVREFFS
jgi:Uma2 family endonuclease